MMRERFSLFFSLSLSFARKNDEGRKKPRIKVSLIAFSPVASRFVFHPNQLIPFMTTSFPVWSTMRPFLVVRKGALEEEEAEESVTVGRGDFFLIFFKGGRKKGRKRFFSRFPLFLFSHRIEDRSLVFQKSSARRMKTYDGSRRERGRRGKKT